MIYKINHDFENTYSLLVDPIELATKMPHYRPRQKAKSLLDGWVEPDASFFKSENYSANGTQLPDVTTWKLGYLVLNEKAYEQLHMSLSTSGEFLPVTVEGARYFIFNPLYIIADAAVNKDKAVDIIDSGVHLGKDNVSFDEVILETDKVSVFKTNVDQLVFSYCNENFKNIYEANQFKGLVFEPVVVN